jgi:hypothetical protein
MKPLRILGFCCGLCAISVIGETPVVVFNSFGPNNGYNHGVVWGVTGGSSSGGYRGQAEWFVPSASGTLSSFTLPTFRQSGSGRSNFFIAQDDGSGTHPGTILESFLNTANNNNGLFTLTSIGKPLLEAGATYWLCDEPADATTVNGWFEGQSYAPGFAFERAPWSWDFVASGPPSGVFSVSVLQVPEPATLLLFPALACWRICCVRKVQHKSSAIIRS